MKRNQNIRKMYGEEFFIQPVCQTITTECCALNMLRATNYDTIETLTAEIDKNKAPHLNENIESFIGVSKGIGARALFCIVSPGERRLRSNLITLGFKKQFEFGRRRGYNPKGIEDPNIFYVLTW